MLTVGRLMEGHGESGLRLSIDGFYCVLCMALSIVFVCKNLLLLLLNSVDSSNIKRGFHLHIDQNLNKGTT